LNFKFVAIGYNGIMPLSTQQKKHLRGLCHALQPVVTIANKGLSETVTQEIETALLHHELIKVRIRQERDRREETSAALIQSMSAEAVMSIGQILCLYRANPDRPADKRVQLPKA